MKRNLCISLFLFIIFIANLSLASYSTVTMSVVEEPVCTIQISENAKFEKKLISKDLNNKEVTLQLQVTNDEISSKPTGELMLVLDNSDSMTELTSSNAVRKDLVLNSAKTLVTNLLEDNTQLKIGIVSFSSNTDTSKYGTLEDALLESPLTSDSNALLSTISNIQANGSRTDLDSGLTLASQNFSEENNNKYMIVLTDGVPNIALDFDGTYYSNDVITKTKAKLESLSSSGVNIMTMLTGISNPDYVPPTNTDESFSSIISKIFGSEEQPTAGKFYYITDDEIEKTITETIYNDLKPVEKTLTDLQIVDYFPKEIIDNFDLAYVKDADIGEISAKVDTNTNSITWTIPELKSGETATVQYKLKLKENFSSSIVDKILNTNQKVDIIYTDFDGNNQSKTSDVSPKINLTEPPATLPKAGTPIIVALFIILIGIVSYSFIKYHKLNNDLKN